MATRKWTDESAWKFLKARGFTMEGFVIHAPRKRMTFTEASAVDCLVYDWDYGFQNESAKEPTQQGER